MTGNLSALHYKICCSHTATAQDSLPTTVHRIWLLTYQYTYRIIFSTFQANILSPTNRCHLEAFPSHNVCNWLLLPPYYDHLNNQLLTDTIASMCLKIKERCSSIKGTASRSEACWDKFSWLKLCSKGEKDGECKHVRDYDSDKLRPCNFCRLKAKDNNIFEDNDTYGNLLPKADRALTNDDKSILNNNSPEADGGDFFLSNEMLLKLISISKSEGIGAWATVNRWDAARKEIIKFAEKNEGKMLTRGDVKTMRLILKAGGVIDKFKEENLIGE